MPGSAAAPLLAATVVVHVGYFGLLALAYGSSDFSIVYPIARGIPPALVLLVSAVLGEDVLSAGPLAGVLLVSVGIASLARGLGSVHRRGVTLALGTAILVTAYTVIDGLAARRAPSPGSFMAWLAVVQGTAFAVIGVAWKGLSVLPRSAAEIRRALSTGALSGGGYLVVLWAMSRAPLAIVSAVRESGVLFGAIIGVVVLREGLGRQRIVGAVVIVTGIVIIQLSR